MRARASTTYLRPTIVSAFLLASLSLPTPEPEDTEVISRRDLRDGLGVYEVSSRYNALAGGVSYGRVGSVHYGSGAFDGISAAVAFLGEAS